MFGLCFVTTTAGRLIDVIGFDAFGITRLVRKIHSTYRDPLEIIWIDAAAKMGMRVERSREVNASWDGCGTLKIGTPETLDPDDCVAQMILHEVCHALCEGPDCLTKPDWGLDNSDPAKRVHEHACLRLQAALADQYRMRSFFAATTFFRSYYDRLPADPLSDVPSQTDRLADDVDPAVTLAQAAWVRAQQGPWANPLEDALRRSAMIARALDGVTTAESIWHRQGLH